MIGAEVGVQMGGGWQRPSPVELADPHAVSRPRPCLPASLVSVTVTMGPSLFGGHMGPALKPPTESTLIRLETF